MDSSFLWICQNIQETTQCGLDANKHICYTQTNYKIEQRSVREFHKCGAPSGPLRASGNPERAANGLYIF